MSSRRRPCPPSAASPLEDDDLLAEILIRLPPQPSSLPRASAVCKRWRCLISDRRFLRRFRLHHRRSPPLLGCFVEYDSTLSFLPTMESPNRVSPGRLSLQSDHGLFFKLLGCRHGLALIFDQKLQQFLVWDPVTVNQHHIAFPPGFDPTTTPEVNGAVLRADGDHFRVVFLATCINLDAQPMYRALVCIYSSETGVWGDLISRPVQLEADSVNLFQSIFSTTPPVLVGDSLYWQVSGFSSSILEFDYEKQSIDVIQVPVDLFGGNLCFMVIREDRGGIGFFFVSHFTAQLWERNTDCDGVASWVSGRTIELDSLLSLDSEFQSWYQYGIMILGFAEEKNMVIMCTARGFFEVQLQSLQFKKLPGFHIAAAPYYYPFESVYTTGTDIGSEHDGGELLHNA